MVPARPLNGLTLAGFDRPLMPQCLKCHYDLRASSPDGRCPECGYPVALSLAGVRPHDRARSIALKVSVPVLVAYTLYCFGTTYQAAVMEPFYRHADWPHLFGYVIVPTAALVLWTGWALASATLVWNRVLRWWWVALIAWSVVASLVLVLGMERYVRDIIEMGSWDSAPP